MPRAQGDAAAETPLYRRIGEAIRSVRGDLTQSQLADLIGSEQGTVSDYEKARSRVPLHVIPAIEDACGVRKGTIFRLAGLVEDSIEAAIESDPALTERGRDTVVSYYRFVRDEYDESKSTR